MPFEAPRRLDFDVLPRLAASAAPAAICCFFDFAFAIGCSVKSCTSNVIHSSGNWFRLLGGFERRIIRITLGAAAIEGGAVRLGERRLAAQAGDEIRIADEGAAEGDEIGFAAAQRRLCQLLAVAV